MPETRAIILAAGKGTRLKSDTPKVLHEVCGRPVLRYIVDLVSSLKTYVVVGFGADRVKQMIGDRVSYVIQDQLLGTGDAVRRVESALKGFSGNVIVLCGDTPLLEKSVVNRVIRTHQQQKASATVLSAKVPNPHGYGRIIRDAKGEISSIREQKDLSANEQSNNEINVGVYCFNAKELFTALNSVGLNAKKREYYLTDVIKILIDGGARVVSVVSDDPNVAFGINTRQDVAQAQAIMRVRILDRLMTDGVGIIDPATTYVDAGAKIGQDTTIYPCSVIAGDVTIGKGCKIGPFARIRPGTRIADGAEVGNFAEVSRTKLGKRVMMKHFSFLGDAVVGNKVNIGAGTVTANYDGTLKNKTTIGDEAFIGSDAILIAPVVIGKKAMVGAGSVVPRGTTVQPGSVVVGVPARMIRKRAS